MNVKRFKSLVEAVLSAVGFMAIEGYAKRHISPENAEREVNRKNGNAKSCFPSVGVNESFDGIYLRFPFDSSTWNVSSDHRHHTTCDVGSILKGCLHKGYSLVMVGRNDKGQFEKVGIEFDTLCPQIPENFLPTYMEDRHQFELANDELDKAIKQAKSMGLIEKRDWSPSGEIKYKISHIRPAWNLAGLPSNGRFVWKSLTDEALLSRISVLEAMTSNLAEGWRSTMGLKGIKDSQVFRILDAGLVETGKAGAVVSEKDDASYVTPEQFEEMLKAGKIEVTSVLDKPVGKMVTA